MKASHAVVARPEVFFNPTQRHADAAGLYRRLLEVTPESARTHANLGVTLYHLGRVEEAVRRFEHALSPDPALETARRAGADPARRCCFAGYRVSRLKIGSGSARTSSMIRRQTGRT